MYSIVNLINRFLWLKWLQWKIQLKNLFFMWEKYKNTHFTFSFPPHFCKRTECSCSAQRQHVNQGEFNKALVKGRPTDEKITRRFVRNRPTNGMTRAGVQYAGWGPEKGEQKKRSGWKPVKTQQWIMRLRWDKTSRQREGSREEQKHLKAE